MFSKVLVANRGEIAIRAYRAAYELGVGTVAVYPHEDRGSTHRHKADESFEIGVRGQPVAAYLNIDEILRVAEESGAEAIYPGYGFLAENADFAAAVAAAGLAFVGPPAAVLSRTGDKITAKQQAREAGVPVLRSTPASGSVDELVAAAEGLSFPLFSKAVAGGGGRGIRRVVEPEQLRGALEQAMSEAETAFGDRRLFLEEAVLRPRHIEVQIMADADGDVVHLFDRDCSVQRRHQKVIEIAPAPNLEPQLRDRLHADALAFARSVGYVNAGTVEFLVETVGPQAGRHVFIEMNPRIQVEHTVTEEVTDVDLVQAQLRVAAGHSLADIGLVQDQLRVRGTALQCRITTEDPSNDFQPDIGRVTTYRSPGGAGIRIDGGMIATGSQVSPYFDSMLAKLTCRGWDLPTAVSRAQRALAEYRIRGVTTNIPFLQAVLGVPELMTDLSTGFIEEHPDLLAAQKPLDRATKVLSWLADVTVNQPHGKRPPTLTAPREKLPASGADREVPDGTRQQLQELGPAAFADRLRADTRLRVTDTTFRDAHQSLLATRLRSKDLLAAAPHTSRLLPQLWSVEAWGGATYDSAMRFLYEDPWDRLAGLRETMPNVALQMLLRGRNTVGYTPYPTTVTEAFVTEAAGTGIDVFRIFDALNDIDQMRPAIDAVRATGTAVAEVAMCYTGNLLDPGENLYTLDYYLRMAEAIAASGAHVLAIKDMAGLLRPTAAHQLVSALRERFELPVHLHTHDTAGGQLATLLAAAEAGVDAVDVAAAPLSGTTSQPAMSALVAALDNTPRETGLSLAAVGELEPYWQSVRELYAPFESGLPAPTGRVYFHEIPGGQLSNLRQQANALGLADRFEHVEEMYAAVDAILGRIPKVTPSSKVVGDLAIQLAAANADATDFAENPQNYDVPSSVLGFMAGELGELPGGWPEPFRSKLLEGRHPELAVTPLTDEQAAALAETGRERRAMLNQLLFPEPALALAANQESFGDVSVIETADYLYGLRDGEEHTVEIERAVLLHIGLEAISEPDDHGMRTVLTTLNGQLRPVYVRDRNVDAQAEQAEKADPARIGHVAAPYPGAVTFGVAVGDLVQAGDQLATIEAMKMEASIIAPVSGRIERLAAEITLAADAGDLLCVVDPS